MILMLRTRHVYYFSYFIVFSNANVPNNYNKSKTSLRHRENYVQDSTFMVLNACLDPYGNAMNTEIRASHGTWQVS